MNTSLIRQAWRLASMTAIYAAALLGAAGTWRWPAGWAFLALTLLLMTVYVLVVGCLHPDLAQERTAPPRDAKGWDKPLVALLGIAGPLAIASTAGLDHRFGWTPAMPAWLRAGGLGLVAASGALTCSAVAANRFFSAVVRIQRDRGHRVVDSGPYRLVRHPAYAASLIHMIATPIALGTFAALAPVVLLVGATFVRTAMEDRTLQEELEGYREYAARVRHRLVPGLW